jgi:hypothetical protein
VTDWGLPKIRSGNTQRESYKSDTIVLITGKMRLPEDLQNQVIDEIRNLFPFDYIICDIPEDEYEKYDQKLVQIYKHYDTVQKLPEQYKHVIRIRNDVVLDKTNNAKDTYRSLICNLEICLEELQKKGIVIGVQHMSARRLINKWTSENRSEKRQIGDFMIFHPRDKIMNPRKVFGSSEKEQARLGEDLHWAWGDVFSVNYRNIVHVSLPLKVYRHTSESEWWLGVRIPSYNKVIKKEKK